MNYAVQRGIESKLNQQIIWIGNRSRREFTRLTRSIEVHSTVVYFPSVEAMPDSFSSPVLFCYAWSRPGEFESANLEPLKLRFPSSCHLNILGELCCGLKRTSPKLQSENSVYGYELVGELTRGRLVSYADCPGAPKTPPAFAASPNLLVAIQSRSRSYRESLADSLSMLKLKTIQVDPRQAVVASGVDYVLWDATDSWNEFPDFMPIRRRYPHAKIVALVASPREHEISHLEENGIQVLAQPYRLRDLFSIFGPHADLLATSAA